MFGVMIVLAPIVGITTTLTIRLGGKPLVETLTKECQLPALEDPRRTTLASQT